MNIHAENLRRIHAEMTNPDGILYEAAKWIEHTHATPVVGHHFLAIGLRCIADDLETGDAEDRQNAAEIRAAIRALYER